MEQWLYERHKQLCEIHDRIEDAVAKAEQKGPAGSFGLRELMYDVRKWRDDAKEEWESF